MEELVSKDEIINALIELQELGCEPKFIGEGINEQNAQYIQALEDFKNQGN